MGGIVALLILLIGISRYKNRKLWYAPDVLFCFLWAAITFMSSLHLYTMYESSDYVYLMILVGSAFFVYGVNIGEKYRVVKDENCNIDTRDFVSKKTFYILCFLFFVLRLKPFITSLLLQLNGVDLQEIRHEHFAAGQSTSEVLLTVFLSLTGPLVECAGIVYFFRNIRKNYICIIIVIILAMMSSITDGGRFGIAFVLIEIFICYSIFKSKNSILSHSQLKKYSKLIYFFVGSLVAFILFVTFLRGVETEELGAKYYRYFCGDIIFFDRHIEYIESRPMYPFTTAFYGFWGQFFPLFHALGLPYPDWYLNATKDIMITQEFTQIGDDLYTNAFATPYYHLYADFRWIGVVFGMLFFGWVAGLIYKLAMTNSSNKYFIIYLLICQMIFTTIFSYPFVNEGYVLIFLYLLVLRLLKPQINNA